MPIYDYLCEKCGHEAEYITRHDYYMHCPECKIPMTRLMHSRYGINMDPAGAHGYYDDNLETYIHTNRQRREVMRQKGVTESGGTPKEDYF